MRGARDEARVAMKIIVRNAIESEISGKAGEGERTSASLRARLLHEEAYRCLKECLFSLYGEKDPFFEKDPMGKPYLPDRPDIHFNLSHCRNGWFAVVCADDSEYEQVGIDIEYRFPFREKLAGKILHPNEREYLYGQDEADRSACLNRIWSRKEAYLKCIGTGIRTELSKIDTTGIGRGPFAFMEKQTPEYTLCACLKKSMKKQKEG